MDFSIFAILLLFTFENHANSVEGGTSNRTNVNQSSDEIPCIKVLVGARLNITYPTKDGEWQSIYDFKLPIDKKQYISSCTHDGSYQEISIEWIDKNLYNTMNLTFFSNYGKKTFTLGAIAFQLATEIFPNGSYDWLELFYFGNSLSAPFGNSYQCSQIKSLPLRLKNQKNIIGTMELSNIQFEAYGTRNNEEFSPPINCRADGKSNERLKWHKNEEITETPKKNINLIKDAKLNDNLDENPISSNTTRYIMIIFTSIVVLIALTALAYFMHHRHCKSTTVDLKKIFELQYTEGNKNLWL